MKTLLLLMICSLAFFPFVSDAQNFSVSWNDNSNAIESSGEAIQLSNGNYLLVKYPKITSLRDLKNFSPNPILSLVNKDMGPIKETIVEIADKNAGVSTLRKYANNVFLTYEVYDNKQIWMYAVKINQQSLLPEGKISLGTIDGDAFERPDFVYKTSADSANILLFVEAPAKKNDNKQCFVGVFDTDFKKKWGRYTEIPIGSRLVSIEEQDVTNDGKVVIAVKHYEKQIIPALVNRKDFKSPSYEYKLFVFSKQGPPKQVSFDLKSHFIQGVKFVFDKNGGVTAAGLYKKNYNGNITGAFYTTFDSSATTIGSNQMVVFPQEILDLVDKDGQGSSKGSDPGVYSYLRIKHILPRHNGTVDLVSEIQVWDATVQTNSSESFYMKEYRNYVYGDIIVVNIEKGGHARFTRIPKRQEGFQSEYALGYYPIVYNDKLVLLYNDHQDNVNRDLSKAPEHLAAAKKCVLAAAIIDDKGNLIRKEVYNFHSGKQVALPKYFSRVTNSRYTIISMTGALLSTRIGSGSLEIK